MSETPFSEGLQITRTADLIEETARLILLTKHHATVAGDRVGQLLLDADLAILGAAPEVYDRYAAAIRREYAWVDDAAYRKGRAAVLDRFLQRPRLYFTPFLHDRYQQKAHGNMERERAALM